MTDSELSDWRQMFEIEENRHFEPRVRVRSRVGPVSLQAKGSRKQKYMNALRAAIAASTEMLFVGDVKVEITWTVEEDARYRTHFIADIDNIVKPLLDGITGPGCVLIDDNQVQALCVSWLAPSFPGFHFEMEVRSLMVDDHVTRKNVTFVEFDDGLCYPIATKDPERLRKIVTRMRQMMDTEKEMILEGFPPSQANGVRSVQRPFPRARLSGYELVPAGHFLGD
ncbi:RusA family crossover junction endodeoxyribonuclease [Nocardia sp. CDC186]|uniref:RusA family crossover junction endodeoxyribonuclease n=1 Tax=Nocardia implantans TaxID=3108168 RepID=A0ABU6AZ42_9NOCA|nr:MULTISPECIES: RusA family crossover junction endodeoxyribonuclease [unclassified Nocardia]MBF6194151.1 RusA family crossover junction endodeoxyribonuclease [Nocardia beijingensis]MEA3529759.1 RusA family crossover junction endodeoxyribonuclease [Nocardia sp. CDC192]MEB3512763.1 RusA family crossover junction endodeoxyribonuclease [Nocardia sp. CDC186]